MTERVDPRCEAARVHLDAAQRAEARAIATELAALARSGRILPGSIQERHTRCGRSNFQWTRKVANKTVGKWLSIDQRDDYQAWVDNDRRAHELLARLEAIGVSALEADARSPRRR
jgi:hypothetical protein